jgi:hypothetical protein
MPPISPEETPIPPARPQPSKFAALEPLKLPVFRMLWSTWLIANICMWMNDVAAAWMMTSLTTSPIWVALVQSASTLPVFLLGLPSGALADILDRGAGSWPRSSGWPARPSCCAWRWRSTS